MTDLNEEAKRTCGFVNQRPAEPKASNFSIEEIRYLIEDLVHPVVLSDEALNKLVHLTFSIQTGMEKDKPPLISKGGQIRKSDEVVTFSNGATLPLDMVLMLGAARMAEKQELHDSLEGSGITDHPEEDTPFMPFR